MCFNLAVTAKQTYQKKTEKVEETKNRCKAQWSIKTTPHEFM